MNHNYTFLYKTLGKREEELQLTLFVVVLFDMICFFRNWLAHESSN